jgi:hypothetical protein
MVGSNRPNDTLERHHATSDMAVSLSFVHLFSNLCTFGIH